MFLYVVVCVYVCICVYVCVCTYECVDIYVHVCGHVYMRTCVSAFLIPSLCWFSSQLQLTM